jgi:hypothetical protein
LSYDCGTSWSRRNWLSATGFYETATLFGIKDGEAHLWIPRRILSQQQTETLRSLLKAKVPATDPRATISSL